MIITDRADNRIAGEPVLRRQRLHLTMLPANESAPRRDPRRPVGIDRQAMESNFVVRGSRSRLERLGSRRDRALRQRIDLQLATLIVTKIAIFESQPDPARRVGGEASHQRHPIRSEFFLHAQVADAEQLAG